MASYIVQLEYCIVSTDMEYKFKLSIVIPVYKVEKYIKSCLESVINQQDIDKSLYEVIIINDGSPDGCIEIINTFEWGNVAHTVITQENKGLGGARNTGLDVAAGEYVWFVDSDDIISSYAVSLIIERSNNCDVINISHSKVIDGIVQKPIILKECLTGLEMLTNGFSHEAPFHIFKKQMLIENGIRFYEGIFHEDTEFTPRCLYFAKHVANISTVLYYYQIRNGSIMSVVKPKRAFDYLIVADSLIKFGLEHNESVSSTSLLNTICLSLNNALYIISQASKEDQNKWNKEFINHPLFTKALRSSHSLKYRVEGYIFSLLPFNKVYLYSLISKLKS